MMSAGKQHWWGSEAGLGDETAGALQASVPSGSGSRAMGTTFTTIKSRSKCKGDT